MNSLLILFVTLPRPSQCIQIQQPVPSRTRGQQTHLNPWPAVATFLSGDWQLVAVKDIAEGDEVCISYTGEPVGCPLMVENVHTCVFGWV